MAAITLTADLTPVEGGHVQAQLVELPAVITTTPVRDELLTQLADALAEYLHAGAPSPPPLADGATRVTLVLTLSI